MNAKAIQELEQQLQISKTFLPRRADTATMRTIKAGIILSKGELFLEYPNSGPGTKGNYYFKVGDGVTPYKDLPYAFGMVNETFVAFTDITLSAGGGEGESSFKSFEEYMESIKSGASLGDIISYLKAAIEVFNNTYTDHAEDLSNHLSEDDRKAFDEIAYPVKATGGSINDMATPGTHYYADSGNDCTDKPNKNKVDAFGLDVYMTATGHLCQEMTEDLTGTKYVRIFNGTTWGVWNQLYTSANPPSSVDVAEKAQQDMLGQRIDTIYVKAVNQKTTEDYVNLAHSDRERQVKHTFTVGKGNNSENTFEFPDENTQYQMHVKNTSNVDGNVNLELTSTDSTSNTVTMKGDLKGSKVTSNGDVVEVNTDYDITIEPHIMPDNVTQNGVDIVLTDINGNRKIVTLRSTDETKVTAVNNNEINFYIPNVAIERLVKVANESARFALTRDQVQTGDSVMDLDTKIMYIVVDDTNLGNSTGYQEYSAHKATELTNPRKIDGVEFKGDADIIHYGSCATPAATAAKEVSCSNFKLVTGARVMVKFTATNTAANPTLNVSSTGAKAITSGGTAIRAGQLQANFVYEFLYDGTNYEMTVSKNNTPRRIDGVYNYGDADVNHYGVCSTAAETAAKIVSCSDFALVTGARIIVKFSNTDTAGACTLNVNSTGAKNIQLGGQNIRARQLQANYLYEFIYTGSVYELVTGRCLFFDGGDDG